MSPIGDLGERKQTAYLLLSECDSTEASVSERRVRLGGEIFKCLLPIMIKHLIQNAFFHFFKLDYLILDFFF